MDPIDKKPMKFDLSGLSVMVAIPVNRDFPWQTVQSLLETVSMLEQKGIRYRIQVVVGSSIVEVARTKVVHEFLKTDCNRLFMIDSDQTWKAKDAMRLIALSTKMSVVLASYPSKMDPPTFMLSPIEGEVLSNEWGCLPIKGIGLGFTIVHREIIKALSDKAPLAKFPSSDLLVPHVFRCDVEDGVFVGEDMAFFNDVRALGHTVWLDPTVNVGHVGGKEYGGSIMDAIRRLD